MRQRSLHAGSCDQREYVSKLIDRILETEKWSEKGLGLELGVSQPAVSKWRSGANIPSAKHQEELLKIFHAASCHIWGSERFFPVCAFSEAYPSNLPASALDALNDVIGSDSSMRAPTRRIAQAAIDIHVRNAELPSGVYAYTFVNDVIAPTVFVVLVASNIDPAEQMRLAWEEIYAHVAKYRSEDQDRDSTLKFAPKPLSVSRSVIRQQPLHRKPTNEGGDEQ